MTLNDLERRNRRYFAEFGSFRVMSKWLKIDPHSPQQKCSPEYLVLVIYDFYSASALLAMQSAVLARGILSVRPSVRLSVRHVPVLCPDE